MRARGTGLLLLAASAWAGCLCGDVPNLSANLDAGQDANTPVDAGPPADAGTDGGATVPAPMVFLPFDEGGGTIAHDVYGTDNGTLSTPPPIWVPDGDGGFALYLDGGTSVDLGNPSNLHLVGSMTVSMRFSVSAIHGFNDEPLVSKRGLSLQRGFQLYLGTDVGGTNVVFDVADGGSYVACYGNTGIDAGVWYHSVGVFDATAQTIFVYLNGQLDGSCSVGYPLQQDPALNVVIGREAGGALGQTFEGTVDDLALWNLPLTAAQVRALP